MRQLPLRLRGSGLASTYSFILSKADPRGDSLAQAYHRLAAKVAEHVAERHLLSGTSRKMTPNEFLRALSKANVHDYARVTIEVEILSVWLSRLAEALHEEGKQSGSADERGEQGGESSPQEGLKWQRAASGPATVRKAGTQAWGQTFRQGRETSKKS